MPADQKTAEKEALILMRKVKNSMSNFEFVRFISYITDHPKELVEAGERLDAEGML